MINIKFDASELERLGRVFASMSSEVKTKAFNRAMYRMRDMARTRVVKLSAKRTDLPFGIVRAITTAKIVGGGAAIDIVEKRGWVPLKDLNHKQNSKGVYVRGRGLLASAFVLKSGEKHVTIRKEGADRYPIYPLFGPNPAHDVIDNPGEFQKLLVDLIEDDLAPRVMHELENLLSR